MMTETNGIKPESENSKTGTALNRVLSFATLTAFGFALGQASGLVREMVVSAQFGLSAEIDAYKLAYLVPTIINNIVAGSTITAAVMPLFGKYISAGRRDEFWYVASVITNVVLSVTGILTVLGMVFALPIIASFGMGLPASTQALAARLLVIMMPTLVLGALLNMLMAVLNSLDRFVGRALIFIALNFGIIVTVLILAPWLGIYAVAFGFTLGVLLQVLIQTFELYRERARYYFKIDWRMPELRQVGWAFLPVTVLAILSQINLAIDTGMAAALPTGSIGALSYANTILGAFYSLGISLGVAVFPALSRMAATQDLTSTARTINTALRILIFVLAPFTLLLIAFANPVVGLLLGRGRFDLQAVDATAQALTMYAIGLIATAMLNVLQPAFYALSKGRTPMIIGALMVVLHITLNVLLIPTMAYAGIALSTSLTTGLGVLLLIGLLTRSVQGIHGRTLLCFLVRCMILAVVSTGAVASTFWLLHPRAETWSAWVTGVALAMLGGSIYLILSKWTHVPESQMLWNFARGFLRRAKPETMP